MTSFATCHTAQLRHCLGPVPCLSHPHLFLWFFFLFCFLSHPAFIISLPSSSRPTTHSPYFHDTPPSPVKHLIRKYNTYPNSGLFVAIPESGVFLTVRDRKNITWNTPAGFWVDSGCIAEIKVCLSQAASALRPICCLLLRVSSVLRWTVAFRSIVLRAWRSRNISSFFSVSSCFPLFYSIDLLDCWWPDCAFEYPLRTH